eukprot:scaffold5969_cov103-Isochrysis_galbana.AAC.3
MKRTAARQRAGADPEPVGGRAADARRHPRSAHGHPAADGRLPGADAAGALVLHLYNALQRAKAIEPLPLLDLLEAQARALVQWQANLQLLQALPPRHGHEREHERYGEQPRAVRCRRLSLLT